MKRKPVVDDTKSLPKPRSGTFRDDDPRIPLHGQTDEEIRDAIYWEGLERH